MSSVRSVDSASFDAAIQAGSVPVLVDFWADWCGPCKMIAPILDEIAALYKDRVQVVKVNVDQCPDIAQKYSIRGIPTLMLFKEGAEIATKVGAVNKSQLAAFLDSHL